MRVYSWFHRNTSVGPPSRKFYSEVPNRSHLPPIPSQCHILSSSGLCQSPDPSSIPAWLAYRARPSGVLSLKFSPSPSLCSHQQDCPCGLIRAQWCDCTRPRRAVPPTSSLPYSYVMVYSLPNLRIRILTTTSISSLVSAKVLLLFFAFENVEISPASNIGGT